MSNDQDIAMISNDKLEYTHIFDEEMFGSAPIYDVLTSCTMSSYIPSYKMEIYRTDENGENP